MKTNEIRIFVEEYEGLDELSEMDQQLILEARKIARTAYAPYSHFRVGASVLLTNGQVISGNNQENSAYPSGLCAERVAMFYANANYPNEKIAAIAISALKNGDMVDDPVRPCGSCRQAYSRRKFVLNNRSGLFWTGKIKYKYCRVSKVCSRLVSPAVSCSGLNPANNQSGITLSTTDRSVAVVL
jgi:cytidine deaminase